MAVTGDDDDSNDVVVVAVEIYRRGIQVKERVEKRDSGLEFGGVGVREETKKVSKKKRQITTGQ